MYCPSSSQFKIDQTWCREEYKKLGKMSYEEIVVAIAFIALSLLWLFRVDLKFGDNFRIPGWINLFKDTSKIDIAIKDGTQTKEVIQTGILGVLFDTSALGVSCQNPRTTTAVNARAEFYTNFNKYDAMYYNDLNENFIVFMIAEPTQETH